MYVNDAVQIVREHYLRDDIYSGTPWDPDCDAGAAKLSKDARHYIVADTNVVLSQVCMHVPASACGTCKGLGCACCL